VNQDTGSISAPRWLRRLLPASGLALTGVFAAYSSCASKPDAPSRTPEVPAQTSPSSTPDSLTALEPHISADAGVSPPTADSLAPTPVAADGARLSTLSPPVVQLPSSGTGGGIATTSIPHVDPLALPLLSDIERELKRDPPPEAHELVAEFRRGADRAVLIDFVRQRFPRDLSLHAIALRWIDRVRPLPGGTSQASPARPGSGGGPKWVAPFSKK
jgi:hypothetical protein